MTDNEIIKALKCCKKDDCENCPNDFGNCYANLAGYALDIIKRQKAEIKNLTAEVEMLKGWERLLKAESHAPIIKKAKAEAVKDLLIRLTMHFASYRAKDTITIKDMFQMIQKIAEEAVGDADGR